MIYNKAYNLLYKLFIMEIIQEEQPNIYKTIFDYWRKRAFETNEELQEKIVEYLQGGFKTKTVYDKKKDAIIEVPILTITWLTLYLWFADRQSFYDYEKRWNLKNASDLDKEISCTLKKARTFIEQEYESQLQYWNTAWAIFALKNFDWKDTQTFEWELNDNWNNAMTIEVIQASHSNYDKEWNIIEDDNEWAVDYDYDDKI